MEILSGQFTLHMDIPNIERDRNIMEFDTCMVMLKSLICPLLQGKIISMKMVKDREFVDFIRGTKYTYNLYVEEREV